MSVVAVRDGVIAADSNITGGGVKFSISKMLRREDVAIGWTGTWVDGKIFAEWYFAGADLTNPPVYHCREREHDKPDFTAIVLRPEGWEYWHEHLVPETSRDIAMPFFTIGAGAQAALAAMHMGATAIEAVEVACKCAAGCALPVESHIIGFHVIAV